MSDFSLDTELAAINAAAVAGARKREAEAREPSVQKIARELAPGDRVTEGDTEFEVVTAPQIWDAHEGPSGTVCAVLRDTVTDERTRRVFDTTQLVDVY